MKSTAKLPLYRNRQDRFDDVTRKKRFWKFKNSRDDDDVIGVPYPRRQGSVSKLEQRN